MKRHFLTMMLLSCMGIPTIVCANSLSTQPVGCMNQEKLHLPAYYDGRIYTSSVKNQQAEGNCWNYLANSLLETSLMKKYGVIEPNFYDFSEEDMDKNTSNVGGNTYGFDRDIGTEGCFSMALAYWTRGTLNGPVSEGTTLKENIYVGQTVHVERLDFKDNGEKEAYLKKIKELVYQYGGVTASYYCSSYTAGKLFYSCYPYYASGDVAYHFSGKTEPNHGSLIVGWDDQYSREKFNPACRPSQDGAFLVKNSWGDTWGNEGYFWISYETDLYDINAIADADINNLYDQIYEYDAHGMIGLMNASKKSSTSAYMNRYQTKQVGEQLTALSTYIASADNTYRLYVSTDGQEANLKEVKVNNAGEYIQGKGYQLPYEGYMTFILEEPIPLKEKYLVAIEVTSNEVDAVHIPVEVSNEGMCSNIQTASNRGYIGSDIRALQAGRGYDIEKEQANLCLKAFTKRSY